MCGIVGYFNLNGEAVEPHGLTLKSMCKSIHHRGPDEVGMLVKGPIALGMTRLAIIDLKSGQQPIGNEDGSIQIVFNGEIYNYQELQKLVLAKGHVLKTNSDTEVIVHLYEEYGVDCLRFLEGMFAFAIHDSKEQKLFIARDRMGEKPLHWGIFNRQLVFGSELKSLLVHPDVPVELNPLALQKYLAIEYVPAPDSMFAGINKLMPAHYLIAQNGQVKIDRYWQAPNEVAIKSIPASEDEACAKLIELLKESTKLRLISDVPLGVFLSGGIDSSSIAALASKMSSERLKTFSIGFDEASFDESEHALAVAKHLGTEHHVETFTASAALSTMQELWQILDEPLADASIVPTYFLSKMTRKHVTVALAGEGGDELFGGYPTYQAHKMANLWQKVPGILRSGIIEPVVKALPVSHNNLSFDYKAKRFISAANQNPIERQMKWMGSLSIEEQSKLLNQPFQSIHDNSDIHPQFAALLANGASIKDVVDTIMYFDMSTYLPDDLLVKSDRASMAASLEVRLPFLAYPLVEFARTLPTNYKLKGMTTKYLLKKAIASQLPEAILKRPKKGFGIPVARWLCNEFKSVVDELLSENFVQKQGIFNGQYVQTLLSDHRQGRFDRRKELWTILMFQWWWRKFFVEKAYTKAGTICDSSLVV